MQIETTKSPAKLLGACGYAGAGKDAFADIMVDEFGYVKVGFADKLYEVALVLNPIIWKLPYPKRLKKVVEQLGWTKAKRIKQVRKYLQWLGTEVFRQTFGEEFLIDQTRPTVQRHLREGKSVIITNCRFENEAEFIEELGGSVILVDRPGVGPVNGHVSDQGRAFPYAIFKVENTGDLEDLRQWAKLCQSAIQGTHPNPKVGHALFEATVQRAIAAGVELVLDAAAPASVEAEKWRSRHKLELLKLDEEICVLVDGESAGTVRYMDNIVEIDVKIAR